MVVGSINGILAPKVVLAAPSQVGGASATPGNERITVSWTQPTGGDTPSGYQVYVNTTQSDVGGWTIIVGGAANTSCVINGATNGNEIGGDTVVPQNGTTYYIRVRGVNGGLGNWSSWVEAVPEGVPQTPISSLDPPANLRVTDNGNEKIKIGWQTVTGAKSYEVCYWLKKDAETPEDYKVFSLEDTDYTVVTFDGMANQGTITGLKNGKEYQVVVRTVDTEDKYSKWSSPITMKPNGVYVYPNPCKIAKGQKIKFTDFKPEDRANIRIYDITGKLVRTLSKNTNGTEVEWDMLTKYGNKVASGVYLYIVEDKESKIALKKGRLTVDRAAQ